MTETRTVRNLIEPCHVWATSEWMGKTINKSTTTTKNFWIKYFFLFFFIDHEMICRVTGHWSITQWARGRRERKNYVLLRRSFMLIRWMRIAQVKTAWMSQLVKFKTYFQLVCKIFFVSSELLPKDCTIMREICYLEIFFFMFLMSSTSSLLGLVCCGESWKKS